MVQTEPLSSGMKRKAEETERDGEEEIGPQLEPPTPLQGNGSRVDGRTVSPPRKMARSTRTSGRGSEERGGRKSHGMCTLMDALIRVFSLLLPIFLPFYLLPCSSVFFSILSTCYMYMCIPLPPSLPPSLPFTTVLCHHLEPGPSAPGTATRQAEQALRVKEPVQQLKCVHVYMYMYMCLLYASVHLNVHVLTCTCTCTSVLLWYSCTCTCMCKLYLYSVQCMYMYTCRCG